jgi:hypothetical protein
MAYTRNWSDTTPADGDNISAGAGEIRNDRLDSRERVDSFATKNTHETAPATLSSIDTRLATNVDPVRIRGDLVDLRGYTWRRPAPVTDASNRLATTTWSPIGNPGGAVGTGSFFLSITPVSEFSLLEIRLQCFVFYDIGATPTTSGITRRGDFRVVQDPAGTPVALTPVASVGRGDGDNEYFDWINLVTHVTGISAATRFEPQFIIQNATPVVRVRGDIQTSHFSIIEHV